MTKKEVFALKPGEKVEHKRYGVCTIDSLIPDFGPNIIPDTCEGKLLLKQDADTVKMFREYRIGTPLLETSFRQLKKYRNTIIKDKITFANGSAIIHFRGIFQKDYALCGADLAGDSIDENGYYDESKITDEKVNCPHCIAIVDYCKKIITQTDYK